MMLSWQRVHIGSMMKNKEDTPERRCIVSGNVLSKDHLIRCVVSPDGVVVPDVDAKLPGRGLWLRADRETVNLACRKNAFSRAAKRKVDPMEGLTDRIEELLVKRCVSMIGMLRRSGSVIFGFEKTRSWLKDGKCAVVLAARDGAEDGRAKIRALAKGLVLVEVLDSHELGQALGRDHVVHMGLSAGRLTGRFQVEAMRLQGFRGEEMS